MHTIIVAIIFVIIVTNICNGTKLVSNTTSVFSNQYTKQIPNSNYMRYILQWTSSTTEPLKYMAVGQNGFFNRKCSFTNCYITADKYLLDNYTKFNAIIFQGFEVITMRKKKLPKMRAPHQKYVFAAIESADYYPVCSHEFDGYFNWTWTYKLNSDEPYGYISIRDAKHKVIGPKEEIHWLKLEDMKPISMKLKMKLQSKRKAAAWIVSNCHARTPRQSLVAKIKSKLKAYNLTVDIYGQCGSLKCPKDDYSACFRLVQKNYYFYFSFENSFSEDYVTEKLLHALQYDTVPVVYGGANYTRFMPDGIYLNANKLGPTKLAAAMNKIIRNPQLYYEFFKWQNHYSYHDRNDSPDTSDYCRFCEMLNDKKLMRTATVYNDFKKWWTPPNRC